jgi:UPF0755 protein
VTLGRGLAVGLLGVALLAAGAAAFVATALAPAGSDAEAIFVVEPGASLGSVARSLEAEGLVRNALVTEWLGRARGVAGELRAGEYELSANLSSRQILDHLVQGRVRTLEVVIPEGLAAREIAQRLEAAGLAEVESFLAAVHDPEFVASLGVEGSSLEGYLFPETYQLARGLAAREVARALVEQFQAVWIEIEPRANERDLDMADVVTLASIVEKETGAPEERPLIASVFLNRLARGMRLESDPTTIYGISDFDGNLTRAHLEDASNVYNTYQIEALPPGPIASPGAESLRAVVDPAESEYLFFVSRNDGTHVFSRSYREHTNAVNRYQRRGR